VAVRTAQVRPSAGIVFTRLSTAHPPSKLEVAESLARRASPARALSVERHPVAPTGAQPDDFFGASAGDGGAPGCANEASPKYFW